MDRKLYCSFLAQVVLVLTQAWSKYTQSSHMGQRSKTRLLFYCKLCNCLMLLMVMILWTVTGSMLQEQNVTSPVNKCMFLPLLLLRLVSLIPHSSFPQVQCLQPGCLCFLTRLNTWKTLHSSTPTRLAFKISVRGQAWLSSHHHHFSTSEIPISRRFLFN